MKTPPPKQMIQKTKKDLFALFIYLVISFSQLQMQILIVFYLPLRLRKPASWVTWVQNSKEFLPSWDHNMKLFKRRNFLFVFCPCLCVYSRFYFILFLDLFLKISRFLFCKIYFLDCFVFICLIFLCKIRSSESLFFRRIYSPYDLLQCYSDLKKKVVVLGGENCC